VAAIAAAMAVGGLVSSAQQPPTPANLVIVVDGLRPDSVTPDLMPRLVRLGQRGVVFNAHHSIFPTVTRLNAASFVTGAYPDTHGVLGNTVYIPSASPTRSLDTGERDNLELIQHADGRLLTAPSLGEILQRSGRTFVAIGSGTSGAAFVLNPVAGTGAIIHTEYTRPPELAAGLLAQLGPAPPHAVPNTAQHRYAVDAYLRFALEALRPAITWLWLSDPDTTAHARGVGGAPTREAVAFVDAEIGRIEDTLRERGLLDRTNLIVTSDHGFSTHTGELSLATVIAPFVRDMDDGSPDVIVADGAIHLRRSDPARVAAIVTALQRRPEVGAIFTRAGPRGGSEGIVPGTLSFDVARWNHPTRAGDILVSANWVSEKNDAGVAGKTTAGGVVAGHGTSSPYDIHSTLIAAGPDFREHAISEVPTASVDLAPTLLEVLGLPIPPTMTGRVIKEGLRAGPLPSSVPVQRATETVKTPDGAYALTAHFSTAAGHRYLDFTDVKRQ
jgi:predicted AlkP superfamily pyrophosphatase or phosphodiesterase